jgi:adenylate cyclase
MASVWGELRRRNVVRVAVAYAITSWLILQLTDVLIPLLTLPEWVGKLVLLMLVVGFPLALFLAWAYELTPEGLKK